MYEHRDDIQPERPPTAPADRVQRGLMLGLVAAVLITLVAAVPGILLDRNTKSAKVRAAAPPATTTTEAAPLLPTLTTPFVTVPPTTAQAGVVTPVTGARPAAPATTKPPATTVPAKVCRNSYDPTCGPFRWDPAPGPNDPLKVDVQPQSQQATAGATVNFKVVATDGDAKIDQCVVIDWNDGQTSPPCPAPPACPTPYGPWTPPAKAADRVETNFSHTYTSPERRRPTFRYQSLMTCNPNPYGGVATGVATVDVTAAG